MVVSSRRRAGAAAEVEEGEMRRRKLRKRRKLREHLYAVKDRCLKTKEIWSYCCDLIGSGPSSATIRSSIGMVKSARRLVAATPIMISSRKAKTIPNDLLEVNGKCFSPAKLSQFQNLIFQVNLCLFFNASLIFG